MSHNIIIKMSKTQLKITRHPNGWEKWKFQWERQSTDVNTEMTHRLEFSDKDSKAVILLKMLQQAITCIFETQEGENPRKEMDAIFKKNQKETKLLN